jgi:DNA-binding PadR family transcriptional regulator
MTTNGASFRYFVLGLLGQRPMSGYDIKRLLERLEGLIGSSSFGNIYPTLHTLLEEGWVTMKVVTREDRPPKKVYRIKREGRQALQAWFEQPIESDASQKGLVMRMLLAQAFSQPGLTAHLKQRRAQIVSHRAALRELSEQAEHADDGWQLALDYGMAVADAELGWLDRTLDQIQIPEMPASEEGVETARVVEAG